MLNNKTLIVITYTCLLGIIAGMISIAIEDPSTLTLSSNSLFIITTEIKYARALVTFCILLLLVTGIYLLLKNGTFGKSIEYKWMKMGIAVIIIGVMFNIMHWPFGSVILLTGFISVFLLYTIHFVKKESKSLLDFGKWMFVTLFLLGRIFTGNHWPYAEELSMISMLLFILILFRFIRKAGLIKRAS